MSSLREIFVKAVCARGRRTFVRMHRFRTKNHPDDLLGCRLTNHRYTTNIDAERVTVSGSYDIHMWYSYTGMDDGGRMHTAVSVQTVEFEEHVPVQYLSGPPSVIVNAQARVTATRHPRAAEISLDADGVVQVAIEDGYSAEVVGETTLWVPTYVGVAGEFGEDKKKDFGFWEAADGDFENDFEDEFDDSEDDFSTGDDEFGSAAAYDEREEQRKVF